MSDPHGTIGIYRKGGSIMKKITMILALSLLPIVSIQPAEAKVCTWKSRQVKNYTDQPYTKYVYKTSRVCR
jgi:hypothetical protein